MAGYNNRLRMPVPQWGSPYTSGQAMLQASRPQLPGGGVGAIPTSGQGFPQPQTQPSIMPAPAPAPAPTQDPSRGSFASTQSGFQKTIANMEAESKKQKVEVTPFMETIYGSMKNIDPEQRADYLSNTASSIKSRLDRYEFRLARGIPLSPEQQRRYDSIRAAYNDIQKYINDPKPYDDYFGQVSANVASGPLTTNQQVSANVGGLQSSPYDYYKTR